MPNKHPFRHMRLTLRTCIAHVNLLLGLHGITWTDEEYALFIVMVEMYHAAEGRTYPQAIGELGAWLRFLRRLIQRLPVDAKVRSDIQKEFDKLSEQYPDLLGV